MIEKSENTNVRGENTNDYHKFFNFKKIKRFFRTPKKILKAENSSGSESAPLLQPTIPTFPTAIHSGGLSYQDST